MKKITLFLVGLILSIGCINAQSELPTLSTNDDGPWYRIQVRGADNDREYRYWTVDKRTAANWPEELDLHRVFGEHTLATSFEDVEKQLFRFENAGDGNYEIINKHTGLYLDQRIWTEHNAAGGKRMVAILSDVPSTDWIIAPQPSRAGYYYITPSTPLVSNFKFAHQANNSWDYSVIFELEDWAYGANSAFHFIEYTDPGLISPQERLGIDFGYEMKKSDPNAFVMESIQILGYFSITADIVVDYDKNNEFFTVVRADGWDNKQGGFLNVYYYPTEIGDHSITVTVSSEIDGKPVSLEVVVKGKTRTLAPENFKASSSIANTDADTWYSLYNSRYGFSYLRDVGLDQPVDAYPGFADQENTPEQLWKFVTVADNEYTLVNKAGRQLDIDLVYNDAGAITTASRFIAVENSSSTFGFTFRDSDGNRSIHWKQYVNASGEPALGYIFKTTATGFSTTSTSVQSIFELHEYGTGEFVDSNYPILSTAANPVWYYMQFNRAINRSDSEGLRYPDAAIGIGLSEDVNPISVANQGEIDVEKENKEFYWRFEGDVWNNLKIISYDGRELGEIAQAAPALLEPGEGATFKFITYYLNEKTWQVASSGASTRNYLNDADNGQNGLKLSGWEVNDPGNAILFTKVEDYVHTQAGTNINAPINEIDGTVIGYVYYTLQGIQLAGEPKSEGLYIQKTIYADRKAKAKTIYVKK